MEENKRTFEKYLTSNRLKFYHDRHLIALENLGTLLENKLRNRYNCIVMYMAGLTYNSKNELVSFYKDLEKMKEEVKSYLEVLIDQRCASGVFKSLRELYISISESMYDIPEFIRSEEELISAEDTNFIEEDSAHEEQ